MASAGRVALLLHGTVQLVFTSGTVTFAVADVVESDAGVVRTGKLVLATVIGRAVGLVLAVWAVRLAVTFLFK